MLVYFLILFFSSQATFAQATTRLTREPFSTNGQAIAGATVAAKNQATGVATSTTTTNESGTFFGQTTTRTLFGYGFDNYKTATVSRHRRSSLGLSRSCSQS